MIVWSEFTYSSTIHIWKIEPLTLRLEYKPYRYQIKKNVDVAAKTLLDFLKHLLRCSYRITIPNSILISSFWVRLANLMRCKWENSWVYLTFLLKIEEFLNTQQPSPWQRIEHSNITTNINFSSHWDLIVFIVTKDIVSYHIKYSYLTLIIWEFYYV